MKKHILLVGNFHSHPSAEAFLSKFVAIIGPSTLDNLVVFSGDFPESSERTTLWIGAKIPKKGGGSVYRFLMYLLNQIIASATVVKMTLASKLDIVILLNPAPIVIITARILRKKAIRHQGGSYSRQRGDAKRRLRTLALSTVMETIPNLFLNRIVIESDGCLRFQDLERFREKVAISSMYVDRRLFTCNNKPSERENVIGYLGGLDDNKGVRNLVMALVQMREHLAKNDIKVAIGGDGPLLDTLKDIANRNGLTHRVEFNGWIPYDEVSTYLNRLKLLVLPSSSEGVPNILLEAMACGTPVLSTPVGGIPDIIKDGETGFIMNSSIPECIASSVIRALDSWKLDAISRKALAKVREEFTLERAIERWRAIVENV